MAVETGLSKSDVLSTLPKPKFLRASIAVVAPVPPFNIDATPVILSAVTDLNENGAVVSI